MANLNKVMIIGRLTRDPELRYIPSGAAVCDITLATTRFYTTPTGEKKEETCFVDVTLWKKQAELCAEYLKKGREVFIEGRLVMDKWETPEGQKRSKLKVVALGMQFLGRPPQSGEAPAVEPPQEEASQGHHEEDVPF